MLMTKSGQRGRGFSSWFILLSAAASCCLSAPQPMSSAPNVPQMVTASLHLGYIGAKYSGVLSASGGTAPHTWRISTGQLPPGLTLAPSGQISGTPTAGGTFDFTATVQDSAGQTASKKFGLTIFHQPIDAYGGFTNLPCSNGPRAHFYTQKIRSRWHLCTPAGNAFWMNEIYNTGGMADSPLDYQGISLKTLISSKYALGFTTDYTLNWSLQAVERMRSWGFNEIAEYALGWVLPVG